MMQPGFTVVAAARAPRHLRIRHRRRHAHVRGAEPGHDVGAVAVAHRIHLSLDVHDRDRDDDRAVVRRGDRRDRLELHVRGGVAVGQDLRDHLGARAVPGREHPARVDAVVRHQVVVGLVDLGGQVGVVDPFVPRALRERADVVRGEVGVVRKALDLIDRVTRRVKAHQQRERLDPVIAGREVVDVVVRDRHLSTRRPRGHLRAAGARHRGGGTAAAGTAGARRSTAAAAAAAARRHPRRRHPAPPPRRRGPPSSPRPPAGRAAAGRSAAAAAAAAPAARLSARPGRSRAASGHAVPAGAAARITAASRRAGSCGAAATGSRACPRRFRRAGARPAEPGLPSGSLAAQPTAATSSNAIPRVWFSTLSLASWRLGVSIYPRPSSRRFRLCPCPRRSSRPWCSCRGSRR